MKTLTSIVAAFGIGLFSIGCTQQEQLDQAQEDFAEERQETADAIQEGQIGGMTAEDQQDIGREQAEDVQQAGEVIQQEGELLEEQVDN